MQSLLRSEQRPAFWKRHQTEETCNRWHLTWSQVGPRFGFRFDQYGGAKSTRELLPKRGKTVENSGVVHLDQLTGLGVRELEAEEEEEETGRPLVVEASDSNSYPQDLAQPALPFFTQTRVIM